MASKISKDGWVQSKVAKQPKKKLQTRGKMVTDLGSLSKTESTPSTSEKTKSSWSTRSSKTKPTKAAAHMDDGKPRTWVENRKVKKLDTENQVQFPSLGDNTQPKKTSTKKAPVRTNNAFSNFASDSEDEDDD